MYGIQYNVLHAHGNPVYIVYNVEVQCTSVHSSCASHLAKLPMCDLKAIAYVMGLDESRSPNLVVNHQAAAFEVH